MPIRFGCPKCKAILAVADSLANQPYTCRCGQIMRVPPAPAPAPPPQAAAPPPRPAQAPPRPPQPAAPPRAAQAPAPQPPPAPKQQVAARPPAPTAPPPAPPKPAARPSQATKPAAPPRPPAPPAAPRPAAGNRPAPGVGKPRGGLSPVVLIGGGLGALAIITAGVVAVVLGTQGSRDNTPPSAQIPVVQIKVPDVQPKGGNPGEKTQTPKDGDKQPSKGPDKGPGKEPEKELNKQPGKEPEKEKAKEPEKEKAKEPEKEKAKEPEKEKTKEPGKEVAKGPDKEPKKETPPDKNPPSSGRLDRATLTKIKEATLYMRVTLPDGRVAQGSGFFALSPGLVLTNAHVLGMLNPDSRRPSRVEAIYRSGLPGSRTFTAEILGVDRSSDLALLRVTADKLPEPLTVRSAKDLLETDTVYIIGFPFGESLGKNVTVSKSSVSSLRTDAFGTLHKVQVNGGMHPGNSGGPVVNERGDVVGVSVSGITATSINFAVPGDFVHVVLNGRVIAAGHGPPFRDGDKVKVPFNVELLDPLGKVTRPTVRFWIGDPGKNRDPATAEPPLQPGDSDVKNVELTYDGKGMARGHLVLPALPAGKVFWTQPSYVNGAGERRWVSGGVFRPGAIVDRMPTQLTLRHESGRRSMELRSTATFKVFPPGERERSLVLDMQTRLGETVQATAPQGIATVSLNYQHYRLIPKIDGKEPERSPTMQRIVNNITLLTARLTVDGQGNIRGNQVNLSRVPLNAREDLQDLHGQISDSLEAVAVTVPNREVKPGERWQALRKLPNLIEGETERGVLVLTYTYEGLIEQNGRKLALIDIEGTVRGVKGREGRVGGRARGRAAFDLGHGQISNANLTVTLETEIKRRGETARLTGTLETRQIRNFPMNLASAREVLKVEGQLTATDGRDAVRTKSFHKVHTVDLTAGRTYVIDMLAKFPANFDPYLRLEGPDGKRLAEDDDGLGNAGEGGKLDSRIVITPAQTGQHRIICTTFPENQTGSYLLLVREMGTGAAKAPDGPPAKEPPPVVKGPGKADPKVRPGGGALAGAARQVGGLTATALNVPSKGAGSRLCWSADGKALFILQADEGVVRRVSYPAYQEELVLEAGVKASWLAMSAEGLVLTLGESEEVWLVDPATLKVTKRMPVPGAKRAVTSPALSVAFVPLGETPSRRAESVAVLDLKAGTTGKTYGQLDLGDRAGFSLPEVSPDGTYLFTVNGAGCLQRYRIKGTALALEETGPGIGVNPQSVGVSVDGTYVCMPSGGGNARNIKGHPSVPVYSTYIYAVKNLQTPVAVLTQGGYPKQVAIDAKAGKIYSQNAGNQLLVFSAKGQRERELALGAGEDTWQILPHSDRARVLVLTSGRVYSVEVGK
jgi:V8-like Glu-specific endopeptidase